LLKSCHFLGKYLSTPRSKGRPFFRSSSASGESGVLGGPEFSEVSVFRFQVSAFLFVLLDPPAAENLTPDISAYGG
jgi:hypothetical protein